MIFNPLNPPYQGDFGGLSKVGVIDRCLLISLIHHSCVYTLRSAGARALIVSTFYRHIAPLERRYPLGRWGFCVFGLLKVQQFGAYFVCLSAESAES